MNRTIYSLFSIITFLYTFQLAAQHRSCGANEYMKSQMEKSPTFKKAREALDKSTTASASTIDASVGMITIPTVVHIVYKEAVENISDAQILSQITALNEDFRRKNADAANTPIEFQHVAADIELEFCLASVDPSGAATTGITRTLTEAPSFDFNDQIKFNQKGGIDAWDTQSYLNIWVGDLGHILGYSSFPGSEAAVDGVVIDYRAFGTKGTATAPFHLGRTTTHEVGHWLNLYHVWGDGGCGLDDGVGDTPLAARASADAHPCAFPTRNTCDEGAGDLPDMFQNFMDYSFDECMNLFTEGQKLRMRSLFRENNVRAAILASQGCTRISTNQVTRLTDCTDGIQNGTETGIDCGGTCMPCPETKIPTFSQWGTLIFFLLILNVSLMLLGVRIEGRY